MLYQCVLCVFVANEPYDVADKRKIAILRNIGKSYKFIQNKYRRATRDIIDRYTNEMNREGRMQTHFRFYILL